MYYFVLSIDSTAADLTATFDSETPGPCRVRMPGVVQPDGSALFSGISTNGAVEITALRVRKDWIATLSGALRTPRSAPRRRSSRRPG